MTNELTEQEKEFIISALRVVQINGNVNEVAAIVVQIQNITAKLTAVSVEPETTVNGEVKEPETA